MRKRDKIWRSPSETTRMTQLCLRICLADRLLSPTASCCLYTPYLHQLFFFGRSHQRSSRAMFARLLPSLSHPPVGPSAFLPPPTSRSLSLFVPLRARTPPSLHAPPPTPRPQHPGYPGTTPTSATGALPEGNRTSIGRITPVKIPAGTQAGASTAPHVIPLNVGPAGSGMAGAGDQGGTLVEELSSLNGEPRGNTLGAIAVSPDPVVEAAALQLRIREGALLPFCWPDCNLPRGNIAGICSLADIRSLEMSSPFGAPPSSVALVYLTFVSRTVSWTCR